MEDFIEKKIINSSDNYQYHKLDIRKSEIVFHFVQKLIGGKASYLIEVKKGMNKEKWKIYTKY